MAYFTTKQLVFIALMAALLFVLNFVVGSWIIALSGVPGSSAFITGITNLAVVSFVALTLRKLGSISLLYLVYGLLALPTPMAGGPPGFVWKIPALVFSALLFELVLHFTKYRKVGFIVGIPVLTLVGFGMFLLIYRLLGMPEYGKLLGVVPYLALAFILLGYVGMWVGFVGYNRLKNRQLMRQISG